MRRESGDTHGDGLDRLLDDPAGMGWIVHPCFHRPISGIDKPLQIFRASKSATSVWRGIASVCPVSGLHHKECEPLRASENTH
jgi:hypothetical protein